MKGERLGGDLVPPFLVGRGVRGVGQIKGVKPIGGFTPLCFCAATVNPPRRCDPWRRMPDSP